MSSQVQILKELPISARDSTESKISPPPVVVDPPYLAPMAQALSGSVSSIISFAFLYPLENIRTRLAVAGPHRFNPKDPLQIDIKELSDKLSSEVSASAQSALQIVKISPFGFPIFLPRFIAHFINRYVRENRAFQLVHHLISDRSPNAGWRQLYSGLKSALFGVGISNLIYFYLYTQVKNFFIQRLPAIDGRPVLLSPGMNLIVALIAGIINVVITQPIWTVNLRLTVQHKQSPSPIQPKESASQSNLIPNPSSIAPSTAPSPSESPVPSPSASPAPSKSPNHTTVAMVAPQYTHYDGIVDAFKKIIQQEGFTALYRGLTASLILVSNPAIQFGLYEYISNIVCIYKDVPHHKLSSFHYFIIGAFSKAVATLLTYPYLTVKSRLQASHAKEHVGTLDFIMNLARKEGIGAFFQGMGVKMTQTVLNAAFMFAIHEQIVVYTTRVLRMLIKLLS
jgi:adenine nucleotide transporter 17